MRKAIIIDDEQHCIDRLKLLLSAHSEQVYFVNAYRTVEDGSEAIKLLQPDLLFLDVQIGAQTGFDLLKSFPSPAFDVIFTTAYDQFAVQAFKVSAVDYLLKPIDADDLAAALQKLQLATRANQMATRLEVLRENLVLANPDKRITVSTTTDLLFLRVNDIVRCQSHINYTTLYLQDGQKIVVAKTLKEFEEAFVGCRFFRIHNSHLINLAYLKSYNKGKGGTVLLSDGTELEVSTRRKDEFLATTAGM